MDNRKKSFLEIGRGAIMERFDYELERVVSNILDPNTPSNKPRKVQLTLTLKPDSERMTIQHEVVVKSTLQPTNPISGAVAVAPDHNGELSLVEMVPQVPGQMSVDGSEQEGPTVIQLYKQA